MDGGERRYGVAVEVQLLSIVSHCIQPIITLRTTTTTTQPERNVRAAFLILLVPLL